MSRFLKGIVAWVAVGLLLAVFQWVGGRIILPEMGLTAPGFWPWFWFALTTENFLLWFYFTVIQESSKTRSWF